ncbi:FecR family protein [Dyadobacter bucti]|uniref:FecR family protein n=1 Tax=Dyadobacter bucti TaxID=2572203 RepID=UPI003F7046F3
MRETPFTWDQLMSEPRFRKWVLNPTPELNQFWRLYLVRFPQEEAQVRQARIATKATAVKLPEVSEQAIEAGWNVLSEKIQTNVPVVPLRKFTYPYYRVAAAAFALLVLAAGLWLYNGKLPAAATYATEFGQVKTLNLPDGSTVSLNANTRMKWAGWDGTSAREVWLDGEAFFDIRKLPGKVPFLVHLPEFDVVVKGTRFNVMNRKTTAEVVLEEGLVALRSRDKETDLHPSQKMRWTEGTFVITYVRQDMYAAWRNGLLDFDETPLHEVASRVADLYGVELVIENNQLAKKTISGVLPSKDLQNLLTAIEAIYPVRIEKLSNNKYLIR